MRFQAYLSVLATSMYMVTASDAVGQAYTPAPIDLFTVADVHAQTAATAADVKCIGADGKVVKTVKDGKPCPEGTTA